MTQYWASSTLQYIVCTNFYSALQFRFISVMHVKERFESYLESTLRSGHFSLSLSLVSSLFLSGSCCTFAPLPWSTRCSRAASERGLAGRDANNASQPMGEVCTCWAHAEHSARS